MEDEEREELVGELLRIAYDLYRISCRIQEMTPLEFRDWILKRCP